MKPKIFALFIALETGLSTKQAVNNESTHLHYVLLQYGVTPDKG